MSCQSTHEAHARRQLFMPGSYPAVVKHLEQFDDILLAVRTHFPFHRASC